MNSGIWPMWVETQSGGKAIAQNHHHATSLTGKVHNEDGTIEEEGQEIPPGGNSEDAPPAVMQPVTPPPPPIPDSGAEPPQQEEEPVAIKNLFEE